MPVTYLPLGETSNAARLAISSTVPMRFIGISSVSRAFTTSAPSPPAANTFCSRVVSMYPGQIVLTLMPKGATSSDSVAWRSDDGR